MHDIFLDMITSLTKAKAEHNPKAAMSEMVALSKKFMGVLDGKKKWD